MSIFLAHPGASSSKALGEQPTLIFAGAGKALVRETGEQIDGSPMVAFKSAAARGVQYSEIHVSDKNEEKGAACAERLTRAGAPVQLYVGEADVTAKKIVERLNPHGLHFAFLDPYNLSSLPFSVVATLAKLKRIDMLIHVSAQDLQRNLERYSSDIDGPLDHFAPGWRSSVDIRQSHPAIRAAYIAHWASKMKALGLPPVRYELVSGKSRNQRLYWLVFVSRSDFANKLWEKIRNVSGQGELL